MEIIPKPTTQSAMPVVPRSWIRNAWNSGRLGDLLMQSRPFCGFDPVWTLDQQTVLDVSLWMPLVST